MAMALETCGSQDASVTSSVNRRDEGRIKGQEYEVLLLALFLERGNFLDYNFEGGFQLTSAGKFDDVIFKYREGTKVLYRYFQLKHRLDICQKITADILLAEDPKKDSKKKHKEDNIRGQEIPKQCHQKILEKNFNLQKYFKSFRDIKRQKLENELNSELKDITIFTNVHLDRASLQKKDITVKQIIEADNILGPDFQGSERLKLKIDKKKGHPLYTRLKETSDSLQLASTLAQTCMSQDILSCDLPIYKLYHIALFKENVLEENILDEKRKTVNFTNKFIDNIELSVAAQNFRKLFETECLKSLEGKNKNVAYLWESLKNKILNSTTEFRGTKKKTSSESSPSTLPFPDEIPDDDIKEFLDHLVLAVKQPNVEEMLDLRIMAELKKNLQLIDSTFITNVYRNAVFAWMNEEEKKKGGFIPGEKVKTFFKNLKTNENFNIANHVSKIHRKKLMNFQLEFKSLNELEKEMTKDNQIIHIKSLAKDLFLTSIKVHQYLGNKEEDRFCFLTQDHYLHLPEVNDILKNLKDILVIECNEDSSASIDKLLDCSKILSENPKKKVILISSFDYEFILKLKEMFPDKSLTVYDNFSFKDLTEESQKTILGKEVIFQGRKTRLEDIIQLNENNLETLEKALNFQTVTQLLQSNNEVKVGEILPYLNKVCSYYMTRILSKSETISVEKLQHLKTFTDVFAVSGCDKETLRELLGKESNIYDFNVFIRNFENVKDKETSDTCAHIENTEKSSHSKNFVLISHNIQFEYLSEKYRDRNFAVHWIVLKTGKLWWMASCGPLSTLRMCRDNEENEEDTYTETEFLSKEDRNVIVAAESGVGKSTLIVSISEKCKQSSDWKVTINLNKCLGDLKKVEPIPSFEDAISLLIKFLKLETSLEREIFRYQCIQGKILIFFDGYDEINYQSRKTVLQLIKRMEENEDIKLWIFTRNHFKEELEDELSLLSYSLQPLLEENQINFLKTYWINNVSRKGNISADKLETKIGNFSENLVRHLYKSINDQEAKFLGIPLHTFMVAEIFEDEIKKLLNEEETEIEKLTPEKLDILILFKKFVEKKFEIVKHEKCKIDTSCEYLDKMFLRMEITLREIHSKLAIKMLFPNEVNDLLGSEELNIFEEKITSEEKITPKDVLRVGIIDSIDENNNPHFLHRSFAEYFAADYFYKHHSEIHVNKFLMDKLFSYGNVMIRKFFDLNLAKNSDIHLLILNNGFAVENINTTWDLTKTDEGGRTPLHLAAARGEQRLMEYLLGNDFGINVTETGINMEDTLFMWSPMRYADKLHNWECVELLLEKKANKEDLVEAITNCNHYFHKRIGFSSQTINRKQNLLHVTARKNFLNLNTVLIEAETNLNARDIFWRTSLHYAALNNNIEIIRSLMQHNCDVNVRDELGCTPLHLAVLKNHFSAVEYLIENPKTDVKVKDLEGATVLFLTAVHSDLRILKYLIKNPKFDILETNNADSTLLHWAVAEDNINMVKFLIDERNLDFNAKNKDENTVLHIAAANASKEILQYLIEEKKAYAFAKNKKKQTILYPAACHDNPEILKYLIEKIGLDIGIQDIDGNTAVHYAAAAGNLPVLKYLLQEKNVQVIEKNYFGHTILHCITLLASHYCIRKCDFLFQMKKIFADKRKKNINFIDIFNESTLKTVKFLIDEIQLDVNVTDCSGNNILHIVALQGSLDMLQYLVEETTVDIKAKNDNGETVLHMAARSSDPRIIQYLEKKTTLDLNEKDHHGNSVAHVQQNLVA